MGLNRVWFYRWDLAKCLACQIRDKFGVPKHPVGTFFTSKSTKSTRKILPALKFSVLPLQITLKISLQISIGKQCLIYHGSTEFQAKNWCIYSEIYPWDFDRQNSLIYHRSVEFQAKNCYMYSELSPWYFYGQNSLIYMRISYVQSTPK